MTMTASTTHLQPASVNIWPLRPLDNGTCRYVLHPSREPDNEYNPTDSSLEASVTLFRRVFALLNLY